MIQRKNILTNSADLWSDRKRYKPNEVVYHLQKIWQNVTGINTEPGDNTDNWILVTNLNSAELAQQYVSKRLDFTYNGGEKKFNLNTLFTVKLNSVIVDQNIHLLLSQFSVDAGIVTVNFDLSIGSSVIIFFEEIV